MQQDPSSSIDRDDKMSQTNMKSIMPESGTFNKTTTRPYQAAEKSTAPSTETLINNDIERYLSDEESE